MNLDTNKARWKRGLSLNKHRRQRKRYFETSLAARMSGSFDNPYGFHKSESELSHHGSQNIFYNTRVTRRAFLFRRGGWAASHPLSWQVGGAVLLAVLEHHGTLVYCYYVTQAT